MHLVKIIPILVVNFFVLSISLYHKRLSRWKILQLYSDSHIEYFSFNTHLSKLAMRVMTTQLCEKQRV